MRGIRVPLLALLLPALVPAARPLYATEGPVEHLTVLLLLVVLVRAARRGWPVVVLVATVLVGEELDWFQALLRYPTPAWLDAATPKSGQANLHNVPGLDLLMRWVPLVGVSLLARRPWPPRAEALARRLRLPGLRRGAGPVGLVLLLSSPLVLWICGERTWDEGFELACVTWVLLALVPRAEGSGGATRGPAVGGGGEHPPSDVVGPSRRPPTGGAPHPRRRRSFR